MTITRNDRNQVWQNGVLITDTPVTTDITAESVVADLRAKALAALAANATFLALPAPTNAQVLAQTKLLTRECNGLIRLALNIIDDTATDT